MALVIASLLLIPGAIAWVCSGGLEATLATASTTGYLAAIVEATGGLGSLLKYILAIFGPIPPMGLLMTATTTMVVMDVLEGTLTQPTITALKGVKNKDQLVDVQGAEKHEHGFMGRLKLFIQIQNDYFSMAHFCLLAYGLAPVTLAAWSLLRKGHKFEYI